MLNITVVISRVGIQTQASYTKQKALFTLYKTSNIKFGMEIDPF